MNRIIETERLLIRPFSIEDAPAAFAWLSDPRVNRYMPYSLYTSVEQAENWIASIKKDSKEFVFVLKETAFPIGAGSVKLQEDGRWEIGYNIRHDCWNRGYTTEAAKALIKWAHEYCGAQHFMARHATANVASGKVLLKCGFQFDRYGEYSRYDDSETFQATHYTLTLE